MNGYVPLSQDSYKAGVLVRGDELASASTATTLRVRDGETVLSDGPFIETKEQLGGYYISMSPISTMRSSGQRRFRAPARARLRFDRSSTTRDRSADDRMIHTFRSHSEQPGETPKPFHG